MFDFDSDKINVGDKVIVWRRKGVRSVEIVERKTPKGMLIVDGTRYKKDGHEYSSDGFKCLEYWAQSLEDEVNAENHRREVLQAIKQTDWSKIQTEKIDRVLAIIAKDGHENLHE